MEGEMVMHCSALSVMLKCCTKPSYTASKYYSSVIPNTFYWVFMILVHLKYETMTLVQNVSSTSKMDINPPIKH